MKFIIKTIVFVLIIATVGQVLGIGDYEIIPEEYIEMVIPQNYLLIDKWVDEDGTSGYEFNDDGTVVITYANFNIPVVNVPFNGMINGTYVTEKYAATNYVTLTYTVFSQTITKQYKYSIENSMLTLIDPETGEGVVYFDQTTD